MDEAERPHGPTEAELVDAARGGDRAAWESLYRSVYPRLRSYLARRVGEVNVEDAVSETMTRAVAGIDRFELGPVGFAGWLYGIARRVSVDHYRRSGRMGRQHDAAVRLVDGDATGPEDALVLSEEHAAIRAGFGRLAPAERELLELRVVAGLSAEEAASVLGKRPGAIRTAQYRALSHLRAILEDQAGE